MQTLPITSLVNGPLSYGLLVSVVNETIHSSDCQTFGLSSSRRVDTNFRLPSSLYSSHVLAYIGLVFVTEFKVEFVISYVTVAYRSNTCCFTGIKLSLTALYMYTQQQMTVKHSSQHICRTGISG